MRRPSPPPRPRPRPPRRRGADLEGCRYRHPLFDRVSPVVVGGDYITTESGTGLVHTAPGHGQEDYQVRAGGRPAGAGLMPGGRWGGAGAGAPCRRVPPRAALWARAGSQSGWWARHGAAAPV